MRIIEVRDGFIKIESAEDLALSSFVEIKDSVKSYIAQIQQVKKAGDYTIAYAKCIFLYDGDLVNYDKTLPSLNSEIKEFDYKELSRSFEYKKPVVVGSFIQADGNICLDADYLNKKTLISIDKKETINIILKNIIKQFEQSLIIDTSGIIDGEKFVAGVDFKLPLNTAALEFMFEDCLNDATSDSKNLIKEIFQDLADYSRTVPFLPFGILKTIVDEMVDKSHIFKLLVLKNKLSKFDQLGYFAKTSNEAENLNKILKTKNAIIDLSKLDSAFLNRYLTVIYSAIETLDIKPQVFVYATNSINKKNLKTILTGEVSSTFATHSRFRYMNEIKSMFSNFIIEPNFANNENFKKILSLLPQIKKDCYLILGEGTNFIPFVSKVEDYIISEKADDEHVLESEILNISEEEVTVLDQTEEEMISREDNVVTEEIMVEDVDEEDDDEFENLAHEEGEVFENNDAILAIDKKSEELIEKVTEEILEENSSYETEIFSDEFDSNNEMEELEPELNIDSFNIEQGEFTNSDRNDNEFHTEIDSTKIVEYTEDLQIDDDNEELTTELVQEESAIEETLEDNDINDDISIEVVSDDISLDDNMVIQDADEISENVDINVIADSDPFEEIDVLENIETEEPLEAIEEVDDNEIIEIGNDFEGFIDLEPAQEENFQEDQLVTEDEELSLNDNVEVSEVNSDFQESFIEEKEDDVILDYNNDELQEENDSFIELTKEDDFIELDESEISDDMIIVDIDSEDEADLDEELDKAIVEDVDKVFTTMKENSISDSDLDFIDELNNSVNGDIGSELAESNDIEELSDYIEPEEDEDGFLQPLDEVNDYKDFDDSKEILETRNSTTPIVPVYDADIPSEDMVMSDSLEQGDSVCHAKYGNGVVEKMIKYGAKTLYSINFDNVGRRLLDPTLTEIKKA